MSATAWNFARTAGGHPAALDGRLDLTDGSGEHRGDVAVVADASLRPGGGTTSARLALAGSSHRLLLWNAGHPGRRLRQHGPANGTANTPSGGGDAPAPADVRPQVTRRSEPRRASGATEPTVGGDRGTENLLVGRPARFSSSMPRTRQRRRRHTIPRSAARSTEPGPTPNSTVSNGARGHRARRRPKQSSAAAVVHLPEQPAMVVPTTVLERNREAVSDRGGAVRSRDERAPARGAVNQRR